MDIAWVRGSNEDDTEGWLQSQFFPACAQIEIASEDQVPLPEGIHIPEDVPHMPGVSSYFHIFLIELGCDIMIG